MVSNNIHKTILPAGKNVVKSMIASFKSSISDYKSFVKEQRDYRSFKKSYFKNSGSYLIEKGLPSSVSLSIQGDQLCKMRFPAQKYEPICKLHQLEPVKDSSEGLYKIVGDTTPSDFLRIQNKNLISEITTYHVNIKKYL